MKDIALDQIMIDPNIGYRLRRLPGNDLKEIKKTMLKVLDITDNTWHVYLRGESKKPNMWFFKALAKIMECTVDEVLDPSYRFVSFEDRSQAKLAKRLNLSKEAA